jgi:hypothetical protein
LVFVISTFAFVARPLLGERTYMAVDLLERTAPYRDAIGRPPDVVSVIQGDQVEQYGPAEIMSKNTIESGEWHTWDPHVAAGTPAGIPPITADVPPFDWAFFIFPAWYAVGVAAALAILTCQWFMYLFLRRLGAAMLPAIIGAIAYTYTGTNLAFIDRIWVPFLLPAMLWAVHRLVERTTFVNSLVLGAFVAWGWYEGFPSAWVYCVATAGGYAIVVVGTRWWRARHAGDGVVNEADHGSVGRLVEDKPGNSWAVNRLGWLAFGFAWGVALSALTLIPLVHEVSARDILAMRTFSSSSHLESINVFGIITSRVPGPPTHGPWWTNLNPFEGTTYLGLAVIAVVTLGLALAAFRRIRATEDGALAWVVFSGVAVLAMVLSYVGTPLLSLVYHVPGFANNPIWRMRFLIGLGAAVLLALTLDSVWTNGLRVARPKRRVLEWWSIALTVVVVGIFVRYLPRLIDTARAQQAMGLLRSDLLRNGAVAAGVLVVVLAAVRWPKFVVVAAVITGTAIYLQLIIPAYDLTPAAPVTDFFTQQSGHREMARLTDGKYRYAASGANFYWNTSEVFGLYDVRGAALQAPEFRSLMHEVSDLAFTRDPFKIQLFRDEWNLSSPVLDHLGVRYFALGTDEQPYGTPDRPLATPTAWVPVGADQPVALSTAVGRIDGIEVPLRSAGACTDGAVRVRLTRNGVTSTTSRPLYDVNGSVVAFAIKSPGDAPGPVSATIEPSHRGCRLEMGVAGTGNDFAGSILHIDDSAPVRLASTDQAWIYERPSASPIVTSYGQWTHFPTQAAALDWLRSRPDSEAGIVPVVGSVPESDPAGVPARVVSSRIEDQSVTVHSDGTTRSLVSAGQVIGDGWQVTVDGHDAPMVLIDGGIMATVVPPGTHTVEFHYRPTAVKIGAALTVGAVIVAVVGLVWIAVRRRRRRDSIARAPSTGHGRGAA